MAFKTGGSGGDTLFGGGAMDTLQGYAGNDRLIGHGGNDVLVGGLGGDRLLGGTGNDLLMAEQALATSGGSTMVKPAGFWNNSPATAVSVDGAFNRANDPNIDSATTRPHVSVEATGDGSIDYYAFTVTTAGSQATFDIDGAYPGFDSWLQLLDSAGTVLSYNDDGLVDPGSVEVYPSFSRDSFLSYTFADAGTYIIEVGSNDNVTPQSQLPRPIPSRAGYALHISLDHGTGTGAQGPDVLKGGAGSDTLIGGAGRDSLMGGTGADSLTGKWGADSLHGGSGGDTLRGAHGKDILWGGLDGDRLAGGGGGDRLHGGEGADTLNAGTGNDRLFGGNGTDRLRGGGGIDRLVGGEGKDTLTGGAGADAFVFRKVADSPADSHRDRITDFFSGSDHINLAAIDADPSQVGDDAFSFIGEAHFSHHAGELRYHHTSFATILAGDVDGDGHADLQIALVGDFTLSAGDFVL